MLGLLLLSCNGGPLGGGGDGGDTGLGECDEGDLGCDGTVWVECNRWGNWKDLEECSDACSAELGCVTCKPGETRCAEGNSEICLDDGSGWTLSQECDAEQGLTCEDTTGTCDGACGAERRGDGLAGCDFWTIESRRVSEAADYSVVLVNPGGSAANIVIDRGSERIDAFFIQPGAAAEIDVDYSSEPIDNDTDSMIVEGLSPRIRSDVPVLVWQANNLWNTSASLDGTAVLPAHRLGTTAVAAAYTGYSDNCQSNVVVVATRDATSVTTTGQGKTMAGDGVDKSGNASVSLDAGDALWIFGDGDSDLSGTRVEASAPVAVLGSNDCAEVPVGDGYYDHLQAYSWPASKLGTQYTAFPMRDDEEDRAQHIVWRVFGVGESATVTTEPSLLSGTVNPGEYLEVGTEEGFTLSATAPVMLVAYNSGDGGDFLGGEASMTVIPPDDVWASESTTYCPTDFDYCWIHAVSDQASVTVNGSTLSLDQTVGAWNTGWVEASPGVVTIESDGVVWAYANNLETYYRASLLFPGSWGR